MMDPAVLAALKEYSVRPTGRTWEVVDSKGTVLKTTPDLGLARRYAVALGHELIHKLRHSVPE